MMKTFFKNTDKFSLSKMISIDETSIYANMVSSYSRCKLGRRCIKRTKDNKVFIKFTLVCAINNKGVDTALKNLGKSGVLILLKYFKYIN